MATTKRQSLWAKHVWKGLRRGAVALALAALSWSAATSAAIGPGVKDTSSLIAQTVPASLYAPSTDASATGSLDHILTATFSGPNRTDKQDRLQAPDNVLAVAAAFSDIRKQLAAQQQHPKKPAPLPAIGEATGAPLDEGSRVMDVAGVDPTLVSAALDAISAAADKPVPASLPDKLAYAREERPATVFQLKPSQKLSSKEMWCLETAIYFEARGESYRGQVGVAQVVMNRVKHHLYPNTICGVVFQNENQRNACQFSFACDGIPETVTEKDAWAQAEEIAKKVVDGELYLTEVANATHYHASYVHPDWAPRLKRLTKIGEHIFYRFRSS